MANGAALGRDPKLARAVSLQPKGMTPIEEDIEQQAGPSDSGQARLEQLGYKQELHRRFGLFSSFAASFSLCSFIMGICGSLPVGFMNGGPVAAVWGWLIVSVGNLLVGMAMAEIASAYPMAGGPYCWTLELAGTDHLFTLVAWLTGWLNMLGQFGATAASGFLTSKHLSEIFRVTNGKELTPFELFLSYAICLLVSGIISSISTNGIRWYVLGSAAFLAGGGAFIVAVLPMLAPRLQPASYVFAFFDESQREAQGMPNDTYVFLVGMLMAQYSFVGYEMSTQLAEETKEADKNGPWAIMWTIIATSLCGFVFLIVLLFCIQDVDGLYSGVTGGYVVLQIFYDVFKGRFGTGMGGVALFVIPLVATFNTAVISMASNARMLWAFSRDGGVPLYRVWAAVNYRTRTPVNATWAMTALAFLLGLPILFSTTAFLAMASICFIGLFTSYAVPIALRVVFSERFEAGPVRMHRLQPWLNVIALLWMTFMVVCLCLPPHMPVTGANLNWTPITMGLVVTAVLVAWFFPKFGASHWYRGKNHTPTPAAAQLAETLARRSLPGPAAAAAAAQARDADGQLGRALRAWSIDHQRSGTMMSG